MQTIIEFFKKNQSYVLVFFVLFFLVRSCKKGANLNRTSRQAIELQRINDSLEQSIVETSSVEYSNGFSKGLDFEKYEIINYILKSTKYPLDLKTRGTIVDLTNDIENNEHRKK
jgi:hypothetical protein